jgi:hypothetical protein
MKTCTGHCGVDEWQQVAAGCRCRYRWSLVEYTIVHSSVAIIRTLATIRVKAAESIVIRWSRDLHLALSASLRNAAIHPFSTPRHCSPLHACSPLNASPSPHSSHIAMSSASDDSTPCSLFAITQYECSPEGGRFTCWPLERVFRK